MLDGGAPMPAHGSPFGKFAGGGDPPVGVPSLLGESGPELFVPKTAGTIIPNDQLGGSPTVIVQQTLHFGSDVNQATLAQWGRRGRPTVQGHGDRRRGRAWPAR